MVCTHCPSWLGARQMRWALAPAACPHPTPFLRERLHGCLNFCRIWVGFLVLLVIGTKRGAASSVSSQVQSRRDREPPGPRYEHVSTQ